MGVFIIGIVSMSLLVWALAATMGTEIGAEKRRMAQTNRIGQDAARIETVGAVRQAASRWSPHRIASSISFALRP